MVKIKIHRGTSQIGGTITEIYTENTHIFIDFGTELNSDPEESTDQKMVDMIRNARCDAVLFSHYHGDHVGLMRSIPERDNTGREIMLGMGLEARKILIRIHQTLVGNFNEDALGHQRLLEALKNGSRWINFDNNKTFQVGDFTITTVRVDHSAYDAYMFIIETEGKSIVHTGDFRTHGRLGRNFFSDLKNALSDKRVDILISEGTMMERMNEEVLTEEQLEDKAYQLLEKPENKWAFLVCSSTNVESLASFCNAAGRLGRPFLVNHYVFKQIEGYHKTAGKLDAGLRFEKTYKFEKMDVINPKLDGGMTQPEYMMKHGFLMLVGTSDAYRKRMEYFRKKDPLLIYSMWEGYVNKEKYPDTYSEAYGRLVTGWRCEHLHTSGHATAADIEEMINIVRPTVGVIPVHTMKKEQFEKLNIGNVKVLQLDDEGEISL